MIRYYSETTFPLFIEGEFQHDIVNPPPTARTILLSPFGVRFVHHIYYINIDISLFVRPWKISMVDIMEMVIVVILGTPPIYFSRDRKKISTTESMHEGLGSVGYTHSS